MLIIMLLVVLIVFISLVGFKNPVFFNRYSFSISNILRRHQFDRIFISTFLHVDLVHLFFNLFSFYSFAIYIEPFGGGFYLLGLFLGSSLGGDFLTLLIHRKHPRYSAVGASGAVSGVIFSSVLIFPDNRILVFPLPIGLPTWLFAIIFLLVSIYGIGRQSGNIGHEAHLGGALSGIFITWLIYPHIIGEHYLLTIGMIIPVLVFLVIFLKNPHLLYLDYRNKTNRLNKQKNHKKRNR